MSDKVKGSDAIEVFGSNTKEQLKSIVERIERLNEEVKALQDDKRDVYAEAKGNGFHTKAIKTIVQMRAKDQDQRVEDEAILDVYMKALGME